MGFLNKVLLLVTVAVACNAKHLPEFISACSKSDPNISECATKQAQKALTALVKGYAPLQFPSLDPLVIPEIDMEVGLNFTMKCVDTKLKGYDTMVFNKVKVDLEAKHIQFDVNMDYMSVLTNYKVNGNLLGLQLNGIDGPVNASFNNVHIIYGFHYGLIEKSGKEYIKIDKSSCSLDFNKKYIQLDSVLGTNGVIKQQVQVFLDDSWDEIYKVLGPAIENTIESIMENIFELVFKQVPYNEIFVN